MPSRKTSGKTSSKTSVGKTTSASSSGKPSRGETTGGSGEYKKYPCKHWDTTGVECESMLWVNKSICGDCLVSIGAFIYCFDVAWENNDGMEGMKESLTGLGVFKKNTVEVIGGGGEGNVIERERNGEEASPRD
ncbi:hypothetical protein VTL71DRAFT_12304 [Oculimacula yallundae]|uniref:Uncharacterized protein n=1 Tax=Oculimacula yallundae TaxID=86028 RepID=A0ABR4CMQ8_9HELO